MLQHYYPSLLGEPGCMQERAGLCRNQALVWGGRTGQALGLVKKPSWCGPCRGHLEGAGAQTLPGLISTYATDRKTRDNSPQERS